MCGKNPELEGVREYERGLRSRGDVTIWLSEDAIALWTPPKKDLGGGQRRRGVLHTKNYTFELENP